jgi:hypothetical protein
MITNAYIYRRTLTRPAIYFPIWLWIHVSPELLIAVCRLSLHLKTEAFMPSLITHTCRLPQPVNVVCELPQPVETASRLPEPVTADAIVNKTLETVTQVVP